MQPEKDSYFVAVKVFLVDDAGRLLIIKDIFDDGWDIPGGRLRTTEFETGLEEVLRKKIVEEVGREIRYELGVPIVFMRHERADEGKEKRRIFAVGYQAKYLGGDVLLGEYLKDHKWVALADFVPEDYFVGGWLKGVKEFQERFLRGRVF